MRTVPVSAWLGTEVDRLGGDVGREVLDARGAAVGARIVDGVTHARMVGRDHVEACQVFPDRSDCYGTTVTRTMVGSTPAAVSEPCSGVSTSRTRR